MFPSDRVEADEVFDPYGDVLAEDPHVLVERARGLQARRDRLDAEEAELLIEVEGLRARGRSGFRDTGAWLRLNTGIARSTARTRSHVAAQMAVLPAARAAWSEGRIGFDHARVLADHADSPNRDNLLDQADEIVAWATESAADEFRDRMAGWARDLDERRDAGLSVSERQRRRRRVTRSRTRDGLRRTVVDLDEESDAVFFGAVRDAAAEMARADRRAKLPPEQQRPFRQLLADAVIEVARRSRGADVITKHRARPTILALTELSVLWDQLRVRGWCQLDNGTKLTARQLRRLACEADIIPMVLDTHGVPLDMGRAVRRPPTANASPSAPYTPPARSRAATSTSTGARSTTSAPGRPAGPPTSTTSSPSAPTTTTTSTTGTTPTPASSSSPTAPSASADSPSPPPAAAANAETSTWAADPLTLSRPAADAGPGSPPAVAGPLRVHQQDDQMATRRPAKSATRPPPPRPQPTSGHGRCRVQPRGLQVRCAAAVQRGEDLVEAAGGVFQEGADSR